MSDLFDLDGYLLAFAEKHGTDIEDVRTAAREIRNCIADGGTVTAEDLDEVVAKVMSGIRMRSLLLPRSLSHV